MPSYSPERRRRRSRSPYRRREYRDGRRRSRSRDRYYRDDLRDGKRHRRNHGSDHGTRRFSNGSRSQSPSRQRKDVGGRYDAKDRGQSAGGGGNDLQEALKRAQQAAAAAAAAAIKTSHTKESKANYTVDMSTSKVTEKDEKVEKDESMFHDTADNEAVVPEDKEVEDIDPLDAFMESEILPEVAAKEAEEKRKLEEEKRELADLMQKGKLPKSLQELIEDDQEEQPDMEIEVPTNKVKIVMGVGGERIKLIQKKSKCRVQIVKEKSELEKGFGVSAVPSTEKKPFTKFHLFGNEQQCEQAREMILEAVENREQKERNKLRQKEKKRESKATQRHIYHLRHARDYEALELPLGASKSDVKAAFRKLALKWHPDKNPDRREEAENRFQELSRAYERLMATDEETTVEQIGFA